jgi:hypothetical protein
MQKANALMSSYLTLLFAAWLALRPSCEATETHSWCPGGLRPYEAFGMALSLAGFAFRHWARVTLSQFFTFEVTPPCLLAGL